MEELRREEAEYQRRLSQLEQEDEEEEAVDEDNGDAQAASMLDMVDGIGKGAGNCGIPDAEKAGGLITELVKSTRKRWASMSTKKKVLLTTALAGAVIAAFAGGYSWVTGGVVAQLDYSKII